MNSWVRLNNDRLVVTPLPGLFFLPMGLLILAAGLLMTTVVLRDIAQALVGGQYLETPTLIARHALNCLFSYLFSGGGLLMLLGGPHTSVDRGAREVRVRRFYGFWMSSERYSFDAATQVVTRLERHDLKGRMHTMHTRRRNRYTRRYLVELDLRDGRRAVLTSGTSEEKMAAAAGRIAQTLGLPVLNMGLVGGLSPQP